MTRFRGRLRKGGYDGSHGIRQASVESIVLQTADNKIPTDCSNDGRFLLYAVQAQTFDLWVMPLTGDRKPFPYVQTSFDEMQGQFSPDGRWLAYHSNETGRLEIYLRPFPGPGGAKRISTTGGASPRWRRNGRELFYRTPDGRMMAGTDQHRRRIARGWAGGDIVPDHTRQW